MQHLDCTIRDGGYLNNWDFPLDFVQRLCRVLDEVGFDFMEIGFWSPGDSGKLWRHCPFEVIDSVFSGAERIRPALLIDYGSVQLSDIPDELMDKRTLLRVATHKTVLSEAFEYALALKTRGHCVSLNAMAVTNYTSSDLLRLCEIAESCLDYVYVADSFGGLLPNETRRIFDIINPSARAKLGFHPHDNLQLALANTLQARDGGASIVDSSLLGLGRGGGNLRSELVSAVFGTALGSSIGSLPLLSFADAIIDTLGRQFGVENDLHQIVSGLAKCHPNIASYLMDSKRLSIDEVYAKIMTLSPDQRQKLQTDTLDHSNSRINSTSSSSFVNPLKGKNTATTCHVVCPPAINYLDSIIDTASPSDVIYCVNCASENTQINGVVFGSVRRLWQYGDKCSGVEKYLISSSKLPSSLPYSQLIDRDTLCEKIGCRLRGSGMLALALLLHAGFTEITFHGADGFSRHLETHGLSLETSEKLDTEMTDEMAMIMRWCDEQGIKCNIKFS